MLRFTATEGTYDPTTSNKDQFKDVQSFETANDQDIAQVMDYFRERTNEKVQMFSENGERLTMDNFNPREHEQVIMVEERKTAPTS